MSQNHRLTLLSANNLGSREFLIFKIFRVNELQHRVPEQVRVLMVVESPMFLPELPVVVQQ